VKLLPFAVTALRGWRQQRPERIKAGDWWESWGLVFTTQSGRPVFYQYLTGEYTKHAKRLELTTTNFHALRQTR
jgi:integrase